MAKFTKNTTRDELESFFNACFDLAPFVRFLFIAYGSTISAANNLLERVNAGESVELKIEALEKGYGI